MHFLTVFSFFANNSRMKQPTPVFLSYMDFPYAIEGGSTIKIFWVLNKLYMAKREAILSDPHDDKDLRTGDVIRSRHQ